MKLELYCFSFYYSELHHSALTVSGFCSSFSHAIINNCWSLWKLIRFKYKPESRCISIKFSDVWVGICVMCVDWCMTGLLLGAWCRASDGGWYLGAGYSWSPWENVHTVTNAASWLHHCSSSFYASQTVPKLITTCTCIQARSHAHTCTDFHTPCGSK